MRKRLANLPTDVRGKEQVDDRRLRSVGWLFASAVFGAEFDHDARPQCFVAPPEFKRRCV
jgi:hypothetical protein